jgi:hypothetical protein
MRRWKTTALATVLLFGASGCLDLAVDNINQPDTRRVLASPADVEQLIANSYLSWWNGLVGLKVDAGFTHPGAESVLSTAAFEHTSWAANFGMVQLSWLPREPINNQQADSYAFTYEIVWYDLYRAIQAAADGLGALDGGVELGATGEARARAWANFVLGLSHGYLGIHYDQAIIWDENADPLAELELSPYGDVLAAALAKLDLALGYTSTAFTIPQEWLPGVDLTNESLARLIHSYKARIRAEGARTPAEREAVNWAQVIADVDAGRQEDFAPLMNNTTWRRMMHVYHSFYGAWNGMPYFISGMADQSGGYQAWRQVPVMDREPFLIQTPDLRFPQGATVAEQNANPGLYIRTQSINEGRPERGKWRWTMYNDYRNLAFYTEPDRWIGRVPEMTASEMRLLKAEGLLRTGQPGAAAELINVTRVGNGGLSAADAAGTNTSCVPKLPNSTCGDLLEMMKWEKRMETWGTRFGSWYFDSRGWGDHAEGTPLHWPVPAKEMNVLQLPINTHGGNVGDVAPLGTYGISGNPGWTS